MRAWLNVRLLMVVGSLGALGLGWWRAQIALEEKRRFQLETQPLADVVTQLSIPLSRGADLARAKEVMFGRLVPRNESASSKLAVAFQAIEAAAARGELSEATAKSVADDADRAARDNLVDESEVDAFAKKYAF